jgi:hypothetical protein
MHISHIIYICVYIYTQLGATHKQMKLALLVVLEDKSFF